VTWFPRLRALLGWQTEAERRAEHAAMLKRTGTYLSHLDAERAERHKEAEDRPHKRRR
jgi:hypothetical protein